MKTVSKTIVALSLGLCMAASPVFSQELAELKMLLPLPDAERGRILFVHKGCVVCHSVKETGGKAGPALDADEGPNAVDPLDFAARMWRGAPAMLALQTEEFGYEIDLSGRDIADLAAFAASTEAQRGFSEQDIPEIIRGWTVDDVFFDTEAAE